MTRATTANGAAITWEGLRVLASFRAEHGCAISFYLDLDPSVTPTPAAVHARARSLVDAAGRASEQSKRELTHDQRVALRADLERVGDYVEAELERNGARGFALFAASLDNLWRPLSLPGPVPDGVRIAGDLFVTPLVPLVGAGEGAIVAHVGRERGDVYRLTGARLVEVADHTTQQPRRHDQGGWSQANYQRHVDALVHDHLGDVAADLDRRVRASGVRAVVIATSGDVQSELGGMLSEAVRGAVAGWIHAEAHASPAELLEGVVGVLDGERARRERDALDRWREDAGRGVRATAGFADTLEAATDGRVDLLLYGQGVNAVAWRCPACGRAQATDGTCPLDGTELEEHDDGLDLAVHQTLAHGGTAMVIADRDLDPAGGVGALLRY